VPAASGAVPEQRQEAGADAALGHSHPRPARLQDDAVRGLPVQRRSASLSPFVGGALCSALRQPAVRFVVMVSPIALTYARFDHQRARPLSWRRNPTSGSSSTRTRLVVPHPLGACPCAFVVNPSPSSRQ